MYSKNSENFSIAKRLKSFKYAFNGLKILFGEEHNARIHLLLTIVVLVAGCFFDIAAAEWLAIVLCIGAVFAGELFNSCIENIADFISPQNNEMIKKIKDLSAAGVLVVAISTASCGLIIFVPKIIALF